MPPIPTGPFTMPMMNGFVPKKIQPWIYVFFAFFFSWREACMPELCLT